MRPYTHAYPDTHTRMRALTRGWSQPLGLLSSSLSLVFVPKGLLVTWGQSCWVVRGAWESSFFSYEG